VWIILIVLLTVSSVGGAAQPAFETSLTGARRATSAGEAKKALRYFEKQAAEFEQNARSEEAPRGSLVAASRAYREASNSAFFLGDLQKAIDHGEKAFALASELDNPSLKLTALSSLHQAYRDIRDHSKSKDLIDLGLQLAQEFSPDSLSRTWWQAVFYAYRSTDFRRRGEYENAIEDANRALLFYEQYLQKMPVSPQSQGRKETAITNMVLIYGRLGRTYLGMGNTDEALKQYQHGLELAKRGNLKFSQGYLFQGLGDVYDRRREYSEALHNFEKALDLARQQQRLSAQGDAARRMGDVYRKMGKISEAIASYGIAIEQTESIRSLLSSQHNRQSFFGGGLTSYNHLIETLWETRAYGKAFNYNERVRARTFLDMLGAKVRLSPVDSALAREERALAELNEKGEGEGAYREFLEKINNVNPEQASLMSVQPVKLSDVQRRLTPRQVLLEYQVTPKRTYLWAVEQSRLRAYAIPVTRKDLVVKIDALRGAISNRSPLDDYHRVARELYDQLLGPVASAIKGKDLIVVPHDVLHYLPFHALYSPEGKYLVEDQSVSYLSSASLLPFVAGKRREGSRTILSIGNPHVKDDRDNLPLAESEATEIQKHFPASVVLLRGDASEVKVKRLAPSYDVLHFAGHAELSEKEPLESAILLAKDAGEDGRLEVREIFGMNLKANLVVLSGCETGLGKLSSGDELVGLTRAFIYAGTPSVVASLWKVDDASTAALMSSFYKNLRTKTKVEALRQAQLEMIRGKVSSELLAQRGVRGVGKLGQAPSSKLTAPGSHATLHPYFWAPFILVGDGK
jgi:CHAT domain-containing protein